MLTPSTRLKLQDIIGRIASEQTVTLQERIFVQKFADRDATVASWLRRARRQQQPPPVTGVDQLLHQLDLGDAEPDGGRRHPNDDIGDWFTGAPGWLRRS
jgi:hypothetical protein